MQHCKVQGKQIEPWAIFKNGLVIIGGCKLSIVGDTHWERGLLTAQDLIAHTFFCILPVTYNADKLCPWKSGGIARKVIWLFILHNMVTIVQKRLQVISFLTSSTVFFFFLLLVLIFRNSIQHLQLELWALRMSNCLWKYCFLRLLG